MNVLPEPAPKALWLIIAPHAASLPMLHLAARLVQRTPVRLVDGGNCFHPYHCARAAASFLRPGQSLSELLERIHIARAFTCYQMCTLLSQTPESQAPLLALDLLAAFYDESVSTAEAQRLLQECIGHLRRISASAPVVISLRPPRPGSPAGKRIGLVESLQAAAQRVWTLEHPPAPNRQLAFL